MDLVSPATMHLDLLYEAPRLSLSPSTTTTTMAGALQYDSRCPALHLHQELLYHGIKLSADDWEKINAFSERQRLALERTTNKPQVTRKYPKMRCKAENCKNKASPGGAVGLCIKHGGGRRCTFPDCVRSVQLRGLCKKHGGRQECSVASCTKPVNSARKCRAHGGGKICSEPKCTKLSQRFGKCSTHAIKRICNFKGCTNYERSSGFCPKHLSQQQCNIKGCNAIRMLSGVCPKHQNPSLNKVPEKKTRTIQKTTSRIVTTEVFV